MFCYIIAILPCFIYHTHPCGKLFTKHHNLNHHTDAFANYKNLPLIHPLIHLVKHEVKKISFPFFFPPSPKPPH